MIQRFSSCLPLSTFSGIFALHFIPNKKKILQFHDNITDKLHRRKWSRKLGRVFTWRRGGHWVFTWRRGDMGTLSLQSRSNGRPMEETLILLLVKTKWGRRYTLQYSGGKAESLWSGTHSFILHSKRRRRGRQGKRKREKKGLRKPKESTETRNQRQFKGHGKQLGLFEGWQRVNPSLLFFVGLSFTPPFSFFLFPNTPFCHEIVHFYPPQSFSFSFSFPYPISFTS